MNCKDYLVSNESFELIPNTEHGYLITTPQPEPNELPKYYDSPQYISHTDSYKTFTEKLYGIVKQYNLKHKKNIIEKYHPTAKSILDIGCGTGEFIFHCQENYEVFGTEPNLKAQAIGLNKKLKIYNTIEQLPERKYSVITLWHVLEHIPNLQETIQKIKLLLEPDGIVIIAVPNHRSYDAQYYGSTWAAYDVPRHLWHFDKSSITSLLQSFELNVVKILPMIFDAFYVSLLSEKNKNGKNNFLKAMLTGLTSNIKALQNHEYSSLIYVVHKQKKANKSV
ncbi:class I SAM-dependent methyltransferase [Robertkochia solimangrovi]|uniref:class I SAM-dependent methyltransferase n=1 Tax=Robertkochia solimangrovi TaxID=2213046 RepID=UPI001180CEF0|nr:class I SAM-dependent methyltransferase [Robertkochia solimangrovi]TRZ46061.1 methyltransferase [Robertkochia solimangrovi]